tara:strand:+ start:451 stop:726 length:276 start_codon:yes stop_codon:yes gene_type:complete
MEARAMMPHNLIPIMTENKETLISFPPKLIFVDSWAHCFSLYMTTFSAHIPTAFPPPLEIFVAVYNATTKYAIHYSRSLGKHCRNQIFEMI